MAAPFTINDWQRLEDLLADRISRDASELSQTPWGSDTREHWRQQIEIDRALHRRIQALRSELELQLDHDGLLTQDFVVIAFRAFEGARYSFVQAVRNSKEAKDLTKGVTKGANGFVALCWPSITRKESVKRFISPTFQAWLQEAYNSHQPDPQKP